MSVLQAAPAFDALEPNAWFAWHRRYEPVWQDPATTAWYVFCYRDVLRVLNPPVKPTPQDPIVFSNRLPTAGGRHVAMQGSLGFSDPPRQKAVRGLLNPAFSPAVILATYAARITALIDELLNQVIESGEVDVVALAYELPVLVMCDLLGLPRDDRALFKHWAALIVGNTRILEAGIKADLADLTAYFTRAIEQRRQHPLAGHPDVISTLARGCPHDGIPLSEEELLGNCELLLLAGSETTAHLLTALVLVLDRFPEIQQQVWQDQDLIPPFIEETLRWRSPDHVQIRFTTQEAEIGGKIIPGEQMVIAVLTSANRDEQVFPEADTFDVKRFAGRAPNHVAFGFRGTHYCLGAPLARLEAGLLMQRLIARVQDIRAVPGVPLEALPTSLGMIPLVNGVVALPVTFKRR
jgi:cytochrome P450